jgi:hypothetical protein
MLQQNSGPESRKETKQPEPGGSGRPFPLVDFISRWRAGNGNPGSAAADPEMYLEDEEPSSPLLPSRKRKSPSSEDAASARDPELEAFVPYPAPSAFLELPDASRRSVSLSTAELNNADDDEVANEDVDDDDDDQQSIKSYDGNQITSYDNRSLRLRADPDAAEAIRVAGPTNMLSNFLAEAGNFLADQRSKLSGDKSRTRLKETEMKNLRWDFFARQQFFSAKMFLTAKMTFPNQ